MLKSTKIKLTLQNNICNALEKRNEIEKNRLDTEQDRLTFDKETKDRVDISKKEYLELLEKVKHLESLNNTYKKTIDKIIKPLSNNDISDELIRKIFFENKFDVEIHTINDYIGFTKKIMLVYKIPERELELI